MEYLVLISPLIQGIHVVGTYASPIHERRI